MPGVPEGNQPLELTCGVEIECLIDITKTNQKYTAHQERQRIRGNEITRIYWRLHGSEGPEVEIPPDQDFNHGWDYPDQSGVGPWIRSASLTSSVRDPEWNIQSRGSGGSKGSSRRGRVSGGSPSSRRSESDHPDPQPQAHSDSEQPVEVVHPYAVSEPVSGQSNVQGSSIRDSQQMVGPQVRESSAPAGSESRSERSSQSEGSYGRTTPVLPDEDAPWAQEPSGAEQEAGETSYDIDVQAFRDDGSVKDEDTRIDPNDPRWKEKELKLKKLRVEYADSERPYENTYESEITRQDVYGEILDTISGAGVAAFNRKDNQYLPTGPASYTKWKVLNDSSISAQADPWTEEGQWQDVEIVSRILTIGSPNDEVYEVFRVMEALRVRFGDGFEVNSSCGLHVHVGDKNRRLPFHTARRLAILVTAFEHTINQIHHEDRVSAELGFALPNTLGHETRMYSVDHVLRMIKKTIWYNDLCRIMGEDRFTAYNFNALHRHGTVEFRQHAATTDSSEVLYWTIFCTSLVKFAHESSDSSLLAMVDQNMMNQAFTFNDLLREIRVPPDNLQEMQSFYGRRIRLAAWPGVEPPWSIEYKELRYRLAWDSEEELAKQKAEILKELQSGFELNNLFIKSRQDHARAQDELLKPSQVFKGTRSVPADKIHVRLEEIYKKKITNVFQQGLQENLDFGRQGEARHNMRREQLEERRKMRHDVKEGKITVDEYHVRHEALEKELPGMATNFSRSGAFDKSSSPPHIVRKKRDEITRAVWETLLSDQQQETGTRATNPWVAGAQDTSEVVQW